MPTQAAGTAPVSFVSTGLEDENATSAEYIHDLKWTAFSMFAGKRPFLFVCV